MNNQTFNSLYCFNGFTLDVRRRSLQSDGREISLSPKEFQALLLLVNAAGNAVERERIIAAVWPDTVVGDTSLARNISSLRRYLGSDAIEVVPKYGYRFALPVSAFASPESATSQNGHLPGGGEGVYATGETARAPIEVSPPLRKPEETAPDDARVKRIADDARKPGWRNNTARFSVTVTAATVIVAGIAVLVAKYLHDTAPTWTDPQTRLTWARRDNGKDVDREQAIEYCQRLDLAGHRDWRLPTIAEVQTLYDPGISIAGVWGQGSKHPRPVYWHVKGNPYLTGGTSANDLTFDGLQEQSYDFSYGRRNLDPPDFPWDHRALCVRR